MINRVILTGRLTNDIELRTTNDKTPYAFFTLAVNRSFAGSNQSSTPTDFIPCIAWRVTAQTMSKYLHKGSLIGVEGKIEVYQQQANDPTTRRVNVNVSNFTFLESKRRSDDQQNRVSQNVNDDATLTFDDQIDMLETTSIKNLSTETSPDDINFDDIEF